MENKILGTILIILSLVFLLFIYYFNMSLSTEFNELGCNVNEKCMKIGNNISMINVAFGFFGFMFGLGFYILIFNKSEKAILKKLEENENKKTNEEKFNLISMALDPYEKKVIKAIKEQDGITQNTLRLRTDMSKAKLSYVLQELEKRNLIKRVEKGRTLQIFLRI